MAIHSSILAWRTQWTEEPEGLQSMGSQGVEHDRACPHTNILFFRYDWPFFIFSSSMLKFCLSILFLCQSASLLIMP